MNDHRGHTPPPAKPAGGYFAALSGSNYLLVTTFRRDGTPVATPVHGVVHPERVYFRNWDVSGKAKRLRHTPRVLVAPCTGRGRPLAASFPASARLLGGAEADAAARDLAGKHPILHGRLIPRYHAMRGWKTLHYLLVEDQ